MGSREQFVNLLVEFDDYLDFQVHTKAAGGLFFVLIKNNSIRPRYTNTEADRRARIKRCMYVHKLTFSHQMMHR
jgi:hypothetical protein